MATNDQNKNEAKELVEAAVAHIESEYERVSKLACFIVAAGNLEPDGTTNWKFISDFVTLPEALVLYDSVKDYTIHQIECQGYIIDVQSLRPLE